jgi:hypothetical protein
VSVRLTQAELMAIWKRSVDEGYSTPLETLDDGRGLDPIEGIAAVLARVSLAVEFSTQALYFHAHSTQTAPPATGGVKATGAIEVTRTNMTSGPIPLLAGDLVTAVRLNVDGVEMEGPEFEVTADTTILGGSPGPTSIPVQAIRDGFQGNLPAGTPARFVRFGTGTVAIVTVTALGGGESEVVIDASVGADSFTPNMVHSFLAFTDGPNAGAAPRRIIAFTDSTTVTIGDAADIADQTGGAANIIDVEDFGVLSVFTGTEDGRSAELDYIALEIDQHRAFQEDDASFLKRIDANGGPNGRLVTPNALIRAAEDSLEPFGLEFLFYEVSGPRVGFVYSGPPGDAPTNTVSAYDDPRAYRKGRFYVGPALRELYPIGFVFVLDGVAVQALGDDRDPAMNAFARAINATRGDAVPWAIVFEPPIGGP